MFYISVVFLINSGTGVLQSINSSPLRSVSYEGQVAIIMIVGNKIFHMENF